MIFLDYLIWHYRTAPPGIIRITRNYIISAWHRFLIARHTATLISPWHRTSATPLDAQSIGDRIGALFMEPILRFIGAVIRLSIIISGLFVIISTIITGAACLIAWILWPAILVAALAWSVNTLLTL